MTEKNGDIIIESTEPLSPQNEVFYEIGRQIMLDSINTSRSFSKYMIALSSGSIPTYLGLFNFTLKDLASLSSIILIISVIPPFTFLLSIVIFLLGYLPIGDRFSIEVIDEIKTSYESIMKRRTCLIKLGVTTFLLGIFLSIVSIIALIIYG